MATKYPTPSSRDDENLIREHLPLVGHAVAHVVTRVPRHVSRDDLVSAGMLALLQAARSFDAGRGVPFAAFASIRIRGALTDELRSYDWGSRTLRTMARRTQAATDVLTAALQRPPTNVELAARLGVEVSAVEQIAADVERSTVVNYESVVLDGDIDSVLPSTGVDPESQILARERCGYLYDAVSHLPDRLRYVVEASFFDDRPLQEIAAELGVTQSRVSQIRSEALALLRAGMDTALEPSEAAVATEPGAVARRRAAYYSAVADASSFRSRLEYGEDDVAERVALSGLGA